MRFIKNYPNTFFVYIAKQIHFVVGKSSKIVLFQQQKINKNFSISKYVLSFIKRDKYTNSIPGDEWRCHKLFTFVFVFNVCPSYFRSRACESIERKSQVLDLFLIQKRLI